MKNDSHKIIFIFIFVLAFTFSTYSGEGQCPQPTPGLISTNQENKDLRQSVEKGLAESSETGFFEKFLLEIEEIFLNISS